MVETDQSLPYATLIHMLSLKLSTTNYLLWKTQVETLLQSQGLFGFLDGSDSPPLPASTAPANVASAEKAKKDWLMQDRHLHSLLLSSLSEESMAETIGCKSSAEVWSALEKDYALQSKTREIQLKDDLQHMRRESLSVADFSSKFRGICDQLASIGSPVPEN
ncbi:unnamed protein product [Lactuca virosa]|uniref:Retrotransposon Copia-like N-terminal domain-containing protein n=1 Tax=Lactuca virosa TaxID=75947 RepID=A0AAU9P024_9ASTR|nr:unnamed protein product [Lactuca virosa]